MVWLTDERRLALFPAEAIIRDPHHRESPTRREQGFEPAQSLSSGFVKCSCAVVITTTPRFHTFILENFQEFATDRKESVKWDLETVS